MIRLTNRQTGRYTDRTQTYTQIHIRTYRHTDRTVFVHVWPDAYFEVNRFYSGGHRYNACDEYDITRRPVHGMNLFNQGHKGSECRWRKQTGRSDGTVVSDEWPSLDTMNSARGHIKGRETTIGSSWPHASLAMCGRRRLLPSTVIWLSMSLRGTLDDRGGTSNLDEIWTNICTRFIRSWAGKIGRLDDDDDDE